MKEHIGPRASYAHTLRKLSLRKQTWTHVHNLNTCMPKALIETTASLRGNWGRGGPRRICNRTESRNRLFSTAHRLLLATCKPELLQSLHKGLPWKLVHLGYMVTQYGMRRPPWGPPWVFFLFIAFKIRTQEHLMCTCGTASFGNLNTHDKPLHNFSSVPSTLWQLEYYHLMVAL